MRPSTTYSASPMHTELTRGIPRSGLAVEIPAGFVRRLAAAQFGMFMAMLAPALGGLSVKIQHLANLSAAPALLGIVAASGTAVGMLTQPIAGRLSDRCRSRFGRRRPFIAGGALGLVLSLLGCAMAPNVLVLLLAWCLALGSANFALAALGASVVDNVPSTKRGGTMGVVVAVMSLGMLTGTLLIASLPNDFLRFLVPGLAALPFVLWFAWKLNDPQQQNAAQAPLRARDFLTAFHFSPRQHRDFTRAWAGSFFFSLGFGSFNAYLTLFLATSFGMTAVEEQLRFNLFANAIHAFAFVGAAIVGGRLSDRHRGRKPFLILAALVMSASLLSVAATPTLGSQGLAVLLITELGIGFAAGLFIPVNSAMSMHLLPDPEQSAKYLGVYNLSSQLPNALAPITAGLVIIPVGNAVMGNGYSLLFALGGGFCAIGAGFVRSIRAAA